MQFKIYQGSRWLTKWMDDGLWKIAKDLSPYSGIKDFGKLYNLLFAVQLDLLEVSIPPLRSDLTKVSNLSDFVKSGREELDESKFLEWYKTRMEVEKIRRPTLLGERRALRDKPSILFATRLWRRMVR